MFNARRKCIESRGVIPSKIVIFTSILVFVLCACADPDSGVQPDWTTYPRDRQTDIEYRIGVRIGYEFGIRRESTSAIIVPEVDIRTTGEDRYSVDIPSQRIGDTATHTAWILPTGRSGGSQEALLALVPEQGAEECGGDYRVSSSTYYLGHEATVGMMGFSSPALQVTFRCPVEEEVETHPLEGEVRALAQQFPDSEYFDVHFGEFQTSSSELQAAVVRAIERSNLPVVEQGRYDDGWYVLAEREGRRVRRFVSDTKIVAIITGGEESADIGYMVFYFISGTHMVALSQGPDVVFGWSPVDRRYAYDRGRLFLQLVDEELQSAN